MSYSLPRLLVLLSTQMGNTREMMEGLIAYSDRQEPIEFCFENASESNKQVVWDHFPEVDGCIGTFHELVDQPLVDKILAAGKPVINMRPYPDPRVAVVCCDEFAIGHLAFEHLHSLGLKHFAALQTPWADFVHQRVGGFVQTAGKAGFQVHLSPDNPPLYVIAEEHPRLKAWLEELPKPVGLFCTVIYPAMAALRACRAAGLTVPEEVSVVGVDRDDLLCNMLRPKLSTIDTGAFRIGYEAASLAMQMLRGRPCPKKPLIFPPGEVIVRQSTNVLAIENADLAAAVRFIGQFACKGIGVKDILAHVPVSRRVLERRFKQVLGRTLHDEIIRVRIQEARKLLAQTNLTILEVSLRCGFSTLSDFCKVFKIHTGLTPREYRPRGHGRSLSDLNALG